MKAPFLPFPLPRNHLFCVRSLTRPAKDLKLNAPCESIMAAMNAVNVISYYVSSILPLRWMSPISDLLLDIPCTSTVGTSLWERIVKSTNLASAEGNFHPHLNPVSSDADMFHI